MEEAYHEHCIIIRSQDRRPILANPRAGARGERSYPPRILSPAAPVLSCPDLLGPQIPADTSGSALPPALVEVPPCSPLLLQRSGPQFRLHLVPNPHFLSTGLMTRFLQTNEPLGGHIGPLMFQFEYLNKLKMISLHHSLELFEVFRQRLPEGYRYCIEIRSLNWLQGEYFDFLAEHGLGHVFL